MIVFTICKNGGNAGVLGASFSCGRSGSSWFRRKQWRAVVRAVMRARVNAGVRSLGTGLRRWVAGSVLIKCARAGRRSMAMKLRRELSPPVFVAVVNYRRPLIASRVSGAPERKLFFPSARWGWGSEGGGARAV